MKDRQINLYGLLEQLPTEQLDEMLQGELQKEILDEDAIRLILRVLKDREPEQVSTVDNHVKQSWERFQSDAKLSKTKTIPKRNWMLRAVAAAAVLCIVLLVAPQTAGAEMITGMLTRWTDSIFEFFDPNDKDTNSVTYEFITDNPGLQQVYDAVVEMGVTDPVVPMWLPEGFELVEIKVGKTSRKNSIVANFINGQEFFIIEFDLYEDNVSRVYQKDENYIESYEHEGVIHRIMKNNGLWAVIWERGHVECFITVDCQKDNLSMILQSIYMEDN